ncbi:TPA: glycosyltransferase family 4 protein [Streptococcus suis]
MRIGFVAEAYPPMSGGVATSVKRLSKELIKSGHEVVVLTFDYLQSVFEDDFWYEEYDEGIHIYRVGPFFLKNETLKELPGELSEKHQAVLRRRAYCQMLNILKRDQVDILLSFYLLNSGWIAQMLANELDLPCVAGIRGNDIGRNIFHVSRFGVIKWVVDEADAVVAVNEHLHNRATVAFKEIRSKTVTITNGFDLNNIHTIELLDKSTVKDWGWDENDLVISFIGSLREKKGVSILLKALEKVNVENVHVRLLVVGPAISGAEKVVLGHLWNRLVERNIIRYTGQISRDLVFSNASVADAICIPSLEDGMANGLLEGMAIGLCPITTTILEDVVENRVHGFVVEPGNVEELVEVFEELYNDRSLIRKYGEIAREHICNDFKPEHEAEKYIALFTKILESRNEYTAL